MKRNTSFILLCFFVLTGFGQSQQKIDSLNAAFKKAKDDSTQIRIKIDLVYAWRFINPDSALICAKEAFAIGETAESDLWHSRAYSIMGFANATKMNFDEAIPYYETAIKMFERAERKFETAKTQVNLGVAYSSKSNYTKALEIYYEALKTLEEIKDKKIISIVYGNIGIIHSYNLEYEKAIDFAERAMKIDAENKNESGVARHLGNIGTHYLDLATKLEGKGMKEQAREKHKAGLQKLLEAYSMFERQGNRSLMGLYLGNIAGAYNDLGDTIKSLEYYNRAYKIDEELDNKAGMSRHLGNMGWIYFAQKKYAEAEDYFKRAIEDLNGISDFSQLNRWHANLSAVYEATGKLDLALLHYKKCVVYRDSTFNIENAKKNLEIEMNFEFQKKEAIAKEENDKQTLYRNIFIAGFAAMFLMAILILRSYRIKQKANKLVSQQKELLEVKNKEITDSIRYAKRIQNAHLPSNDYISKKLKELKNKS
jgi:tetratricopeptide (TPR) repeat protein